MNSFVLCSYSMRPVVHGEYKLFDNTPVVSAVATSADATVTATAAIVVTGSTGRKRIN